MSSNSSTSSVESTYSRKRKASTIVEGNNQTPPDISSSSTMQLNPTTDSVANEKNKPQQPQEDPSSSTRAECAARLAQDEVGLFAACIQGQLGVVQQLLQRHASLFTDIDKVYEYSPGTSSTLLVCAATHNKGDIVRYLVEERQASVDASDEVSRVGELRLGVWVDC